MAELIKYLERTVQSGASDLFLVTGTPVCMKKGKQMVQLEEQNLSPQEANALITSIYELARRPQPGDGELKDDDFAFTVGGLSRFRVNTYRQRGTLSAVLRAVPFGIPDWQKMHIPPEVMELAKERDGGLVLVTGTAGSGKSTTLACILHAINLHRPGHIITLEDPIEYLHRSAGLNRENGSVREEKCIISQREISIDTKDYPSALRACLRQSPDVILLGEMRDQETIQTAMTAAETGHLVLATLHTKGAIHTVDRIVDAFPGNQQGQIRAQLSMVLKAVVSQQLLTSTEGETVPAFELMRVNTDIAALIRSGKTPEIKGSITGGYRVKEADKRMFSMDQYIVGELYEKQRLISPEEAQNHAYNRELLDEMLELVTL